MTTRSVLRLVIESQSTLAQYRNPQCSHEIRRVSFDKFAAYIRESPPSGHCQKRSLKLESLLVYPVRKGWF